MNKLNKYTTLTSTEIEPNVDYDTISTEEYHNICRHFQGFTNTFSFYDKKDMTLEDISYEELDNGAKLFDYFYFCNNKEKFNYKHRKEINELFNYSKKSIIHFSTSVVEHWTSKVKGKPTSSHFTTKISLITMEEAQTKLYYYYHRIMGNENTKQITKNNLKRQLGLRYWNNKLYQNDDVYRYITSVVTFLSVKDLVANNRHWLN